MKSQFSKIAKIRKQKRDAIEKELLKSQNQEKRLMYKISSLHEEIVAIKLPQNGAISLLSIVGEQKKILNRDKKQCEHDLQAAKHHTQKLQVDYQKAHIEYEKIKYLEEQELQALMDKIKQQEQLDLDEISTMLFANKKGNR